MHCYFYCVFVFQVHSNETIGSVRQRIANKLKYKSDQIQMVVNDKMVSNISFICSELVGFQAYKSKMSTFSDIAIIINVAAALGYYLTLYKCIYSYNRVKIRNLCHNYNLKTTLSSASGRLVHQCHQRRHHRLKSKRYVTLFHTVQRHCGLQYIV